jgi:large subunit ribosomal protein L25
VSEVRLSAQPRNEFGKGGARRTRRAGLIPAVIYGHGADPRHISLPSREFGQALKQGGANVLLTLSLEGNDQLVIPKAIQRHPLKGIYEHVDLLAVRLGEKVTIDVPVVLIGDNPRGAVVNQENTTVSVEAEATHLPSEIELDLTGLEIGSHITAGDLALPGGTTLVTDAEQLIVSITEATASAEPAVEDATAAAEPAAADE